MKKNRIFALLFIFIVAVTTLSSCQDRKTDNTELSVIFYTGYRNEYVSPTRVPSLINHPSGELAIRPEEEPTAKSLIFLGWYKDSAGITPFDFENEIITKSTIIYAKWETVPLYITYEFDELGGELIDDPVDVFDVSRSQILPKADRPGGLFLGWIKTPVSEYKVGDRIYKSTQTFVDDTTLYALFEGKEYTVRFRSLLDGVRNPGTHVVKLGTDIAFPVLEDTDTKRFVGWFSLDGTTTGEWGFQYINDELFKGKADYYDPITEEWVFLAQGATLYAKWEDK